MHHVIIGAGPSGIVAAEYLRKHDPDAQITVVGKEPEPPYSRMAIPYLLIDKIEEEGTYLRKTEDHYSQLNLELVQDRVTAIDTQSHEIQLSSGGSLNYDKLLIATGAAPVVPPIPGIEHPSVHNCWTLDDARKIIQLAQPDSRVVLMGAGFIGCIILEALALRGVNLTVVEMENRMVPRMMNQTSGNMIKRWCESKGVNVLTSTRVTAIGVPETEAAAPAVATSYTDKIKDWFQNTVIGTSNTDANTADTHTPQASTQACITLDNGEQLTADLIISATGVKPNIDFLTHSGIDVDQGIIVDEFLQTSAPDVYASGDVAQGKDFSTGSFQVQAIQPTAVEHGKLAANNMAKGHEHIHWGNVNMNVLDTLGLISSSFGLWDGSDNSEAIEYCNEAEYKYICLQIADNRLIGASTIGLTEHVGVIRGLIQGQVKLGKWETRLKENPLRLMEAYLACAQQQA